MNNITTIVQLGASKGTDHVTSLASKHPNVKLLLVEANPLNIETLKLCYKDFENCIIENAAIVIDDNIETVPFHYSVNDGHNGYEVSSVIKKHVADYYDESSIRSIDMKCYSLEKILNKHNITDIDYLFIDVEMLDADIILSFPLEKYNIKNIQIEYLHIGDKVEAVERKMSAFNYIKVDGIDAQGYDKLFIKQF
jgi:FkbM family methyltransferase